MDKVKALEYNNTNVKNNNTMTFDHWKKNRMKEPAAGLYFQIMLQVVWSNEGMQKPFWILIRYLVITRSLKIK